MTDNTPTTLTCPSCGAPLDFDGRSAIVQCKFCKTSVLLPGAQQEQEAAAPAFLEEIRRLVQGGDKVEAARRYRERFGVGLKEAKDAVESLASGSVLQARVTVSGPLTAEEIGRVLEQVQELLRHGDKVEAIRYYRASADVSLTKAKEVVDQVEAALTGMPVPPRPEISGHPSVEPQPVGASSGARLGCSIVALILLLVGGILAFVFTRPGAPPLITPALIANGPAILVRSETGGTDIVAAFYNINSEELLIGLVDGESGNLLWQAAPLDGEAYFDAVVYHDGLIYTASETDLLAYRLEDGSLAWQAVMPDRVNYSGNTLLATDGQVIASTIDQSIQAYDSATGARLWERRLYGYDRALRLMGDSLVVVDYTSADSYDYALIFLDPATGSQERLLTPGCVYDEYTTIAIDPDTPLLYEESNGDLYFISDDYYGCVQRLDLARGEPLWSTIPEGGFSFVPYNVAPLDSPAAIFFGNDDQLLGVDKNSGEMQALLASEDYEFLPLALSGDSLLVRARRTRGSERFELWGVEAGSRSRLWQMDMGSAKPVDPPNELVGLVDADESGWTWNLLAGQLVLVEFRAEPAQLVIRQVDPATGSLSSEMTVNLPGVSGDFYSVPQVIGWEGSRVYFVLDAKIYCVDVAAGEVLFHFR